MTAPIFFHVKMERHKKQKRDTYTRLNYNGWHNHISEGAEEKDQPREDQRKRSRSHSTTPINTQHTRRRPPPLTR